jgi:hypothetical protein
MPLDPTLNFNFSTVDQTAINTGLDNILLVLNGATVPYVNLTKAERQGTPSIGPARLSYVHEAVNNIIPLFTPLASPSIPLARTTTLFQLATFITSIAPKMAEIKDRLDDLGLNAENLVYKSMSDSYGTAQIQEGRMPGADVLLAAIAPLFADQGSNANEPTPPGPGDPVPPTP